MIRRFSLSMIAIVVPAFCVALLSPVANVQAADTKQEAALRKELADASKRITTLQNELAQANAKVNQLQADLKKAKSDDTADNKSIKTLTTQLDGIKHSKYVHIEKLTLKSDSEASEVQSMMDDANATLTKIKQIRWIWIGKPIEASSDANILTMIYVLDDAAGFKAFKADPQYKKFTDKHTKLWGTPVVMDFTIPAK